MALPAYVLALFAHRSPPATPQARSPDSAFRMLPDSCSDRSRPAPEPESWVLIETSIETRGLMVCNTHHTQRVRSGGRWPPKRPSSGGSGPGGDRVPGYREPGSPSDVGSPKTPGRNGSSMNSSHRYPQPTLGFNSSIPQSNSCVPTPGREKHTPTPQPRRARAHPTEGALGGSSTGLRWVGRTAQPSPPQGVGPHGSKRRACTA
jgi:hypothetical protein